MIVQSVRVFPEAECLLIAQSGQHNGSIQVVSTATRQLVTDITPPDDARVLMWHQYVTGTPLGQISLDTKSRTGSARARTIRVSPLRADQSAKPSEEQQDGDLRLAGTRLFVDGERSCSVQQSHGSGPVRPAWATSGIDMEAFPVPDSVIQTKTARGWNLVAHESTFMVMTSVPNHDESERELLVFSRTARTWRSIIVPGNVSSVRALNGWVIGEVIQRHLPIDMGESRGALSLRTGSLLLLNPQTMRLTTLDIEGYGEVLWIESDTVYYRDGEKLFRGRVADTNLIDRQLILSDPRVKDIHWAFRSQGAIQ